MGYMLNVKQFHQSMAPKTMSNNPGTEEYYAEGPKSVSWEQARTYGGESSNQDKKEMKRYNQSRIAKGKKPTKIYESKKP
jgi:hypothetical protein